MSNLENVFIYFSFLLISKNIFGLTQCGINHNGILEQKARKGHKIFHEDLPSVCKFEGVINSQTKKVCGGNFISKNDVLTSATCIKDILREKLIKISLAESKRHIGDYFSEMSIAKVMNHQDFNKETMENNIAIVRLQIPEYISNFIHPICIPENDADMLELKSVLVGPGKNGSLSMPTVFPESFLAAMIDIHDTNCCNHIDRPRNFVVNDKNICAGSRGKGSSEGDTGSPLLVNSYGSWYQIGIVSFGMSSNKEIENQDVYPSVYTRISKYCDFIESVSEARCQKIGSLSSLFSKATSYMKQKKCPYAKFQALLNASSAENKHLLFLIMASLILFFIHVCTYM